ncbi:calcium-binding protein 39 isoform X2 [Hippopotamus amphibius kiboko]|nr:calcium-binding protein 39 isoform X2 [Hippopotamus amphibius kiboko]
MLERYPWKTRPIDHFRPAEIWKASWARRYKAGLEGQTGFGREEGCRREPYVEGQQSWRTKVKQAERSEAPVAAAMPFPFGKSHKSPADIVKNLKESMAVLEKQDISDKKAEKATEEVSKNLVAMKEILYGTNEKEPQTEAVAQLAQELYNSGLLSTLVADLQLIDFEGKKDVAQIFNNILRRQIGTRTPTVEYICTQQNILFMLLKGYESPEIALNCGIMLRECIRHEPLAKIILWSEQFYDFFRYVEMSTFDIASDAFATFKFFSEYEKLLHSENYVTKRQSLKLLGELLLDRHNFTIMTKYISKPENLKLMMNLLRDKSRNIQFEAFHVFKVFVANPNKTQPILDILLKNQTKLIEFLSKFQNDRTEDEQFNDEKTYLVKQIRDLKRPAQQEA